MRSKLYGATAVVLALGVAVSVAVWRAGNQPSRTENLTLADSQQIMSSLLYIAITEDYFAGEELAVNIQAHAMGKRSLAAVVEGKADIATVAEVPFMHAVLEGHPVQVFATIQTTDKDIAITARTDVGIKAPKDLTGKRIGTILGTNGEYFLDLFLTVHGLKGSGVVVVPFEPEETPVALAAGSIDAISAWTMIRLKAQEKLPDGTISFFEGGLYTEAWTLAAREAFLQQRPGVTQKLLRALLKAERFAAENPQRAIDIVARQLDLDRGKVAELWDHFGFTIRLDQALLVNLEGQARTAIQAKPQAQRPNFLNYLHLDGLLAVAPHRVTVLR